MPESDPPRLWIVKCMLHQNIIRIRFDWLFSDIQTYLYV